MFGMEGVKDVPERGSERDYEKKRKELTEKERK